MIKSLVPFCGSYDRWTKKQQHVDDKEKVGNSLSGSVYSFAIKFDQIALDPVAEFGVAIPTKKTVCPAGR
jgi:hypothetical protein